MYPLQIRRALPSLQSQNHDITSPDTDEYNCIAWAAGEDDRWWWPANSPHAYWPPDVPRVVTVEAFILAFETLGYHPCDNGEFDPGVEKVVLYVNLSGEPTHMARQLPNGMWTSKCGQWCDISHDTPDVVAGGAYGVSSIYLARLKK